MASKTIKGIFGLGTTIIQDDAEITGVRLPMYSCTIEYILERKIKLSVIVPKSCWRRFYHFTAG